MFLCANVRFIAWPPHKRVAQAPCLRLQLAHSLCAVELNYRTMHPAEVPRGAFAIRLKHNDYERPAAERADARSEAASDVADTASLSVCRFESTAERLLSSFVCRSHKASICEEGAEAISLLPPRGSSARSRGLQQGRMLPGCGPQPLHRRLSPCRILLGQAGGPAY